MRAGYYTGDRTYEVREIPDREPEDDEVKIEVAWCGLCGTDIHKFEGKNGASPVIPPIILGHECSGIVTAVGPKETGSRQIPVTDAGNVATASRGFRISVLKGTVWQKDFLTMFTLRSRTSIKCRRNWILKMRHSQSLCPV